MQHQEGKTEKIYRTKQHAIFKKHALYTVIIEDLSFSLHNMNNYVQSQTTKKQKLMHTLKIYNI